MIHHSAILTSWEQIVVFCSCCGASSDYRHSDECLWFDDSVVFGTCEFCKAWNGHVHYGDCKRNELQSNEKVEQKTDPMQSLVTNLSTEDLIRVQTITNQTAEVRKNEILISTLNKPATSLVTTLQQTAVNLTALIQYAGMVNEADPLKFPERRYQGFRAAVLHKTTKQGRQSKWSAKESIVEIDMDTFIVPVKGIALNWITVPNNISFDEYLGRFKSACPIC
jgi:hypothetical protein